MPNQLIPKSDDQEGYCWLHIDDFTPGIYDFDYTSTPAAPNLPDLVPAPLGSCWGGASFQCIGLPNRGLAPLPGFANTPVTINGPSTPLYYIVGVESNTVFFYDFEESGKVSETELVVIFEYDNGTNHYFVVVSYIVDTATQNTILNSSSATTGQFWGSPYPQWTLLDHSAVPHPVLVFPSIVYTDSQGRSGHMYNYPSLTATTAYGTDDMLPGEPAGALTGQLICYDGRVLGIGSPNFTWPPGSGWSFSPNEYIEYTDPPGSQAYFGTGAELAILVPENPFGYGAAGSISAGELFLVKKRGGGVLVLGDIDAPSSVTYLPGVQPVGNFYGKGESCAIGYVYCSEGFGAWVWNGSNVSQKISSQLDDNFFVHPAAPGMGLPNNYGFFIKRWGDFLLFSNNYVYSLVTQSWWILTPNTGAPNVTFYHYVDAKDPHQIYALPLNIPNTEPTNLWTLDTRTGAPAFLWTSTELYSHITKTSDRVVDIREVIIRASAPIENVNSVVEVSILSNDTVVASGTSTVEIGNEPTVLRFNTGAIGLSNFKIQISSRSGVQTLGSSIPAPTVWSIDLAYRTRAKIAANN